jgi:DNA-directed RNA polymerase subunit RPC12/RpoP
MAHSELHCPHCGSDRVFIYDHQPLATFDKETPIDKEIYVHLQCDYCGDKFETVGDITYRQPTPIKKPTKTIQYLITVEVNADVNAKEYGEAIELAMEHSDNVASQIYSSKINLVVSES